MARNCPDGVQLLEYVLLYQGATYVTISFYGTDMSEKTMRSELKRVREEWVLFSDKNALNTKRSEPFRDPKFIEKALDLSAITVLIAEDNRHMRQVLRALLSGLGVNKVIEADNGAAAMRQFETEPVDVLITDWEMPELTGLELVRRIRDHAVSPDPDLPVIMLSGHASKCRVLEARDAGITEFLSKPMSASDLHRRLVDCFLRPHPVVHTQSFFGPDRRRFIDPSHRGQERRSDPGSSPYSFAQTV